MQPPTFSGGVNLKLEATLSFLRMVENLFEGELSEKVKVRAISFSLRERGGLVLRLIERRPTRVPWKHGLSSRNNSLNIFERLKDLRQGTLSI